MNKRLLILASLFLAAASPLLNAQQKNRGGIIINTAESVCYGSDEVRMIYIPPPQSVADRKGGEKAQIEVIYLGFPEDARTAFEYAVNIWSSLLSSDVKIRIRATWTSMSEPGVLGSASSTTFYKGSFIGALNPDAYYAVSLAEKIAGVELNPGTDFDIRISFNSTASWFFGLSGGTPSTSHDFVTVVLHELCHGLGFADSFATDETTGSYGFNGIPVIYDTFIEDNARRPLTGNSVYPNPSAALLQALTSGSLYFGGPVSLLYKSGQRISLYAPGVFDSGSSISHLSESATPQVDALMTPFIARGEAIHDPGKLTLSMLADLGWIHTRLDHTPVSDTEEDITSADIITEITSDTLLKKNGFSIIYKYDDAPVYDTVTLDVPVTGGSFRYSLPIPAYNTMVSYYLTASDTFGRVYKSPAEGIMNPYTFFVGSDTVSPVISHTPPPFILSIIDSLVIEAEISDNLYPVTAAVQYNLNGGVLNQAEMDTSGGNYYTFKINLEDLNLTGVDTIYYRILATDAANTPNTGISPEEGFHKVAVHRLFDAVDYYFTPFSHGDGDFLLDGFSVIRPAGFENPALHSRHPYESPEVPDETIEYQAILKYPIAIDESGLFISFREIVLVEPGEPLFPFGTEDFYDYVVVEASKDGGKTWNPLADGYDSSDNPAWFDAYNLNFNEMNSTYVGTPDLFVKRTISVPNTGVISEGDTIVIRFRLFSDPYANGWGWAIDDLFIKGLASSVATEYVTAVSIYPNPGDGRFTIDLAEEPGMQGCNIIISDYSGRIVKQYAGLRERINYFDISAFPAGIYLIILEEPGGRRHSYRYLMTK